MKPGVSALPTIIEDEDLVPATSLSNWPGPNASASNALDKASKRRRRRKAKGRTHHRTDKLKTQLLITGTKQESDVIRFKALWEAIASHTKESLTPLMGQLAKATVRGQDEAGIEVVAIIEFILYRAAPTQVAVVSLFMATLREASIPTLNAMLALAENELRVLVQDMGRGVEGKVR